MMFNWPNIPGAWDGAVYMPGMEVTEVMAPAPKPAPQIPPEVWQTEPVDTERAIAAVRAMCGG